MEATLTQAIADYIEQRKQNKLEPLQKALNKVLDKSEDTIEIATAKAEYAEKSAPFEEKFNIVNWLSDAARRAKQLSLATHAPKYTHGDAKSSSVYATEIKANINYLNTVSLKEISKDFSGNSASFDVAGLLKVTIDGESLIDQLKNDSIDALRGFTEDETLLTQWKDGFKLALADEKLSSHTLSKQIYFPIDSDKNESAQGEVSYHLLCPLFSSALAHKLYKKVTSTRFGDSKDIRDVRRAGKFDERIDASFPNTAVQMFGGSKPQNISLLNTERYGQSFLLNCAPPTFKKQVKPPLTSTSLFNRQFTYKVLGYLREFKAFLSNLSPDENNFKTRYKRDQFFITPIIEQLMNHAASIQLMEAGWATNAECKLKHPHALWLDVYNPNEAFQREREKGDWINIIATDFASWLSKQLKNDEKYRLSDIEHAYFSKLCLHHLKRFEHNTPKVGEL